MTSIKPTLDFTINVQNLLVVVSLIIAGATGWANIQNRINEHAEAIAELKADNRPLSPRLAVIETQLRHQQETLNRIDRRVSGVRGD